MIKLSELEVEIVAALRRLRETPMKHKPYVIVEDTVTKKFVQFCTPPRGGVLIDLPTNELSSGAARTAASFLKHNGSLEFPAYEADCPTDEWGAKAAMRVLREVHQLPEFAELRIFEETSTPEHKQN
jgi:hypothetical protein